MGTDPAHISLIVDRLHSRGLIERRINDADRRARKLYLTPKGRALWRRLLSSQSTIHSAWNVSSAPLGLL
jgi:DNA-binding MarR family transcriptional regulator